MQLSDYEKRIEEIQASTLSDAAKQQALEMTADEISGAAWQPHAREAARELAGRAREAAEKHQGDALKGLDELAAAGLLKAK